MPRPATLTIAGAHHIVVDAVQAAPGPAGRVEPTCSFRATSRAFVQPVLRAVGDVMHGGVLMDRSADRLNLDHLKKQAKQLIRLYRSRDTAAMARFRSTLPATAGLSDEDILSQQLRLHDAQSCIAREHGFASWPDLKRYVEVQAVAQKERAVRVLHWAQLVYSGDVSGTVNRANPRVALRILADDPDLAASDPILPARSATSARCGRRCRPTRHGSTYQVARCDCRRFSRSRIRVCCAWKNFASGCIAARHC